MHDCIVCDDDITLSMFILIAFTRCVPKPGKKQKAGKKQG